MSATEQPQVVTYGGWRVSRPAGLGKFTLGQTLALFICAAGLVMVEMTAGLSWAVVLAAPLVLVALISTVRDKHGLSWFDKRGEKMKFRGARRRKTNLFRTGLLDVSASSSWRCRLPGVLGSLNLSEHQDAWGRVFTVVHHGDGRLTVPMALAPAGEDLVDRDAIERKVALWGLLLMDLANETGVVGATVTVETSPDTGQRLVQEVSARRCQDGPELARQIVDDVVAAAAGTGVRVRTWVTVSFRPEVSATTRRDRRERAVQEIAMRLPGLTQILVESGDGAVHLLDRQEMTRVVREAYDPESAAVFEQAAADGLVVDLDLSEAGPISAEADWDSYRHDSGLSRSWVMSRPPRGLVQSRVLRRVLEVSRDVEIKRVTILYRPVDPSRAPDVVEKDVDKATARQRMARRPTERMSREVAQAVKTAHEEASGAAVLDFGVVMTATVTGDQARERLETASAAVTSAAAGSHLLTRVAYGAQDTTFAMGLPLGLVPSRQQLTGGW
ncbi:SCO6880 family protein [Actinomyces howellii]|uniref:Type VII secretion protein EccE n=1 Tax=Actinomyces howellii TaxID=52771 RepID=A0A3S4V6C1_9ACTO|nr:SCO6880 family protein [Actinomyces howellii]VEG30001.1 Uncharacterised protein [Actinomyces howellii]